MKLKYKPHADLADQIRSKACYGLPDVVAAYFPEPHYLEPVAVVRETQKAEDELDVEIRWRGTWDSLASKMSCPRNAGLGHHI